jgi:hypothetical protein
MWSELFAFSFKGIEQIVFSSQSERTPPSIEYVFDQAFEIS